MCKLLFAFKIHTYVLNGISCPNDNGIYISDDFAMQYICKNRRSHEHMIRIS